MSGDIKVDDRVALGSFASLRGTVRGVDGDVVWVKWDSGSRDSTHRNFLTVVPPPTYPERWINVYHDHIGYWYATKAKAQHAAAGCIAVIHLASDGTVTLHPVEPS